MKDFENTQMNFYKTELHAHTSEVSPCADLRAPEVAERYIAAGYTTVNVTNHYCDYVMDPAGETWQEKIDHFLSGYRIMKDYAKDRLNVLLGCELRFVGSMNDYLIFGLTEAFLIAHPDLHRMTLKSFSGLAKENGLLIVQAHPFRNGMMVSDPALLDGIEVFNGHPGHDSRNDIADLWAKKFHLLRTSGSDFHHPTSIECAGIMTDTPVTNEQQLAGILRDETYLLHCSGPAAERDGMHDMPAKYGKEECNGTTADTSGQRA